MNDKDRDLITEARRMSAILRSREGDTDRLAGWLLDALADLALRLDKPEPPSMMPAPVDVAAGVDPLAIPPNRIGGAS